MNSKKEIELQLKKVMTNMRDIQRKIWRSARRSWRKGLVLSMATEVGELKHQLGVLEDMLNNPSLYYLDAADYRILHALKTHPQRPSALVTVLPLTKQGLLVRMKRLLAKKVVKAVATNIRDPRRTYALTDEGRALITGDK
jgi:DNA-binding MarR family transcriptional regulator